MARTGTQHRRPAGADRFWAALLYDRLTPPFGGRPGSGAAPRCPEVAATSVAPAGITADHVRGRGRRAVSSLRGVVRDDFPGRPLGDGEHPCSLGLLVARRKWAVVSLIPAVERNTE